MIFLEATMIVIGLAAVIISFRISDKKVSNTAEVDMEANMQKFDEVKEELFEVVDFMKNPEKYIKMGAKIPKGI